MSEVIVKTEEEMKAEAAIAAALIVRNQREKDLKAAQQSSATARAMFIASLPYATPAQASAVVDCALCVQSSAELVKLASGLNTTFRLTEEQQDQVAAAKAQHKVEINTPDLKAEAVENVRNARLKSYKLRLRADGKLSIAISGTIG